MKSESKVAVSNSIPWHCSVCSREFATPNGGACFRCKRPACFRHLKVLRAKAGHRTLVVEGIGKMIGTASPEELAEVVEKLYEIIGS